MPRDLTALAEIAAAKGNFRQADRLFEEAEDVLDGILINQHSFEESTARAGSMSSTYLEHFRLALQMGDIGRAFQVLERVRGRTVASQLYAKEKSRRKSPRLAHVRSQDRSYTTRIAANGRRQSKVGASGAVARRGTQARLRIERSWIATPRRACKTRPVKTIQAVLGDDEVLARICSR